MRHFLKNLIEPVCRVPKKLIQPHVESDVLIDKRAGNGRRSKRKPCTLFEMMISFILGYVQHHAKPIEIGNASPCFTTPKRKIKFPASTAKLKR